MSNPYPPVRESNGLATAALVCGIVGLFIFEFVLGPLAIIFGAIGLSKANRGAAGRAMALWGLILGIVDTALIILVIAVVSAHNNGFWHI
jgi:Domain of unknown function (DUF4190)